MGVFKSKTSSAVRPRQLPRDSPRERRLGASITMRLSLGECPRLLAPIVSKDDARISRFVREGIGEKTPSPLLPEVSSPANFTRVGAQLSLISSMPEFSKAHIPTNPTARVSNLPQRRTHCENAAAPTILTSGEKSAPTSAERFVHPTNAAEPI